MTTQNINGIRVIIPSKGYWLYNEKAQVVSDKVFLGVNAPEDDWTEISDERKVELEDMWESENNSEN